MKTKFITPILTILQEDGNIDRNGNLKQMRRMADGGIDAIALLGSTGEFCHLNQSQRKEMIDIAKEAVADRVPVMVGAGTMSLDETMEIIHYAESVQIKDILLVSPYYFTMSQESIFAYYDTIASQTDSRIYLYNYPDRTGNDITEETVYRLAKKHSNIVGYKDTVADILHTQRIINRMVDFPDFEVYVGFEYNYLTAAMSGAAGCIGGLSNIEPSIFTEMRDALEEGNIDKIERQQQLINLATQICGISVPFIPAVKRALLMMGVIESDRCAMPIEKVSDEEDERLRIIMKKLNFIS